MDQGVNNQLIKYLEFKLNQSKLSEKEQKDYAELINLLNEDIDEGICYGYAITDAAFDSLGYGEWWQHVLLEIRHWNGEADALNKNVDSLKKYLPASHTSYSTSTLESLFERTIHYVLSAYRKGKDSTFHLAIPHPRINSLLDPKERLFEVSINNEIKFIQQRAIIAGKLKRKQLKDLLDPKIIAGNIFLIDDGEHIINIKYKNNQWVLHDSNYDYSSIETMYKVFPSDNKDELIDEIKKCLSSSALSIEIASFDKNTSFTRYETFYDNLNPDIAVELIEGDGLHKIALFLPEVFTTVLNAAAKAKGGPEKIAQALANPDNDGETGLMKIVDHTPESLANALSHIPKTPEGSDAVADLLSDPLMNALHLIARYIPDRLPEALTRLSMKQEGPRNMESSLMYADKDGNTGIHMLAQYAPASLWQAVKIPIFANLKPGSTQNPLQSSANDSLKTKICTAFAHPNNEGNTALHLTARYSSESLYTLYAMIGNFEEASGGPQMLAKAVRHLNQDGQSGLYLIARYGVAVLPQVISILLKTQEGPRSLAEGLLSSDKIHYTALHWVIMFAPQTLPALIDIIEKLDKGSEELTKALNIEKTTTPLFIAAQEGKLEVVKLLLEKKADPTIAYPINLETFRRIAKARNVGVSIEQLIAEKTKNLKVNEATVIDISPADIATVMGHHEIAKLCLQQESLLREKKQEAMSETSMASETVEHDDTEKMDVVISPSHNLFSAKRTAESDANPNPTKESKQEDISAKRKR